VVCRVGALAFALSHVYTMLTPSMGRCSMPLMVSGAAMPVASRMVGTISMTWWNWRRMPPVSLIWPGQDMTTPCAVPPKCDGTCFTHLNGVSIAHAAPSPPRNAETSFLIPRTDTRETDPSPARKCH
jgi:hypothetical protein